MKKLFGYALVILNTQTKKTRIASGFVITDTKSEAEKSVLHYAFKKYPTSKHWSHHQFRVVQAQDTFTTEDGQEFQTLVELTSTESAPAEEIDVPPLPEQCVLDPALAKAASKSLDIYESEQVL